MKALALFVTLVCAKIAILAGRPVPFTIWSAIAFIWQDAAVALIFAAFDRVVRRPFISWILYAALVFYAAMNVPLARLLSTPLTWTMLRATRSTLADSITHHVTLINIGFVLLILTIAGALPWMMRRLEAERFRALGVLALLVVLLGPIATKHVETTGLHRNALVALVTSALPRVSAAHHEPKDWRDTSFGPKELSRSQNLHGAAKGRNVVLILLESTAAQYLGIYGAAQDPMPTVTRLAREALVIENAYAAYPESIKGLFSILCSRYPAFDTAPEIYENVASPSLPEVMAGLGYKTGLFHSGRFMYLGMESIVRNRGYQTLEDAGDIGGNRNSSFGVDEPSTVRRMLAWIDAMPKSEQFFLTYLPIAGHHPYDVPEPGPFDANSEVNRYRNALRYSDGALAELLEGFRARALSENTLFVVMGDHGEAFNQHEGNYGHTLFLYEENVRVPYLIAAPGLFSREIRLNQIASLIDTAPTVLDLIGAESNSSFQGESLLGQVSQTALFYTDYSLGLLGLRDRRWKFIHDLDSGRSKLFDLENDPHESNNLSAQFPTRVASYREHLQQWSAAQKANITGEHSSSALARLSRP